VAVSDGNDVSVENFSIHFDIELHPGGPGAGQIREEIYEQIEHPAIVKSRTSVVREGPFTHKLGD